ncbi:MAG: glycosyltransferase family 39 protein [Pirellulales bacterium]|nr:glycosyltransferase family 39 protein [Pirellulales bacterium]
MLLVVVLMLLMPGAGAPWVDRHYFASAAFATIARNQVQLGLRVTKGASVLRVDPRHPEPVAIYAHHPYGFPLLLAAVFRLAGATELAARGTAIACSLATAVLLYALMRRAFGWPTALVATALFGFAPGTLSDGRIVSLEQPVLTAIVAAIWCFDRWMTSDRRRDFWLLFGVLVAGMMIEWQAYYLSAILPAAAWLIGPRPVQSRSLIVLALLAPAMFVFFLLHTWLADPQQIDDLYQTALFRAGLLSGDQQLEQLSQVTDYAIGDFFVQLGRHLQTELTLPLCVLALVGLVITIWKMRREPATPRRLSLPLLLAAPAVCHTLLFSNAMYVHDCLSILFLPAAAALGSLAFDYLWSTPRWRSVGLVSVAMIFAMFVFSSLRETAHLRDFVEPDAWIVGTELLEKSRADDAVLIVGLPYNPGVFWYANRMLWFAGDDGEIVGEFRKPVDIRDVSVVAVLQGTTDYLAKPPPADRGGRQFYERVAQTWQRVQRDFVEVGRTDNLIFYRPRPINPMR